MRDWIILRDAILYALGTWWGITYLIGVALTVMFCMLEEFYSARGMRHVPGLESTPAENVGVGLIAGLFMGVFWPVLLLFFGWAGVRHVLRRQHTPKKS
jgi:hypothetical protein